MTLPAASLPSGSDKFAEPKHTPGPWTIEKYSRMDKEITILEPRCMVDNDDVDPNEAAANARLIAAAPDLLAALYKIAQGGNRVRVDWPASHAIDRETMCDLARSAIAKAGAA